MRKITLTHLLILGVITAVTVAKTMPKWTDPEPWRQKLKRGMRESAVRIILGNPADKETTSSAMVWYYQECPTRINGRVTDRPSCGIVKFRKPKTDRANRRKPIFTVWTWKEPDWETIPKPVKIESQTQIKQSTRQQKPKPPQKSEAEIQAEREERQRKKAEAKRLALEHLQKRQEEIKQLEQLREAEAKERQKQADNSVTTVSLIAGGAFFVLAILGAIFFRKTGQ